MVDMVHSGLTAPTTPRVSVPVEPTEEMVACAEQASQMLEWQIRASWSAMLAAAPAQPVAGEGGLLPCPFCGEAVHVRKGVNGYGHCQTKGCHANRAQIVALDDQKQVAAWNLRSIPAPVREEGGAFELGESDLFEVADIIRTARGVKHVGSKDYAVADEIVCFVNRHPRNYTAALTPRHEAPASEGDAS